MAGEDYGTGVTKQNPSEWFTGYIYNTGANTVTFQLEESASKGFTEAGYNAGSGDVRQVFHGVIDKLYSIYTTKEGTSGFNMPDHLKMGKAEVKDTANNKKKTVYTFTIEQDQTLTSGNASYIDENNA